ncbi:MAG: RtcB family protein [Spirochaetota bacterium]|jgi:tRNA-splicing ligase RtcB|nr:RtcB family protein [Spirochaetota bacterium]HHU96152.1 RtcB family protein [Petrimonas sp.]
MKRVILSERIPIKVWMDSIDDKTMEQTVNLANLPFAFKHVSLMPDAHSGYGMPIGGVLATEGVIVPNAVGVDIGCGMCAVKSDLMVSEVSRKEMLNILSEIRNKIPIGFNHHKEKQDESLMPQGYDLNNLHVISRQYTAALKQIGTLGGGNHFIEIQKDSEGFLWLMIHSGSRNLGKQVADFYNKKAGQLNELWYSSVDKSVDLAFLPFRTNEARQYYDEMRYCVDFALANRKLMIERVQESFYDHFPTIKFGDVINKAHNYAAWENHFDKDVVVHRKGATSAREGEIGIIPGSQGTNSYIVEGLGNKDSFNSCSHGAGRTMGRKEAVRNLDLEEEKRKLDALGIIHAVRSKSDLEEAPSAYKDIEEVMANQQDLVRIKVELSPVAVIKG